MRSIHKLLTVLTLALLIFSQSTSSAATNVYAYKGKSIHAYFSSVDPSGCIVTTGFVFASQEVTQDRPGAGSPAAMAHLYVSKYDQCTDQSLVEAESILPIPAADLNISGSLRKASLHTTVSVYNSGTQTSFDLAVDLAWLGTDTVVRQNTTIQYDFPTCRTNNHSNSTFHYAQARGTISDGTTNFSLEPSTFGTIALERGGEISIHCDS